MVFPARLGGGEASMCGVKKGDGIPVGILDFYCDYLIYFLEMLTIFGRFPVFPRTRGRCRKGGTEGALLVVWSTFLVWCRRGACRCSLERAGRQLSVGV